MTSDDFYAAKVMENDGWEFIGEADDGDMLFTRFIGEIAYAAKLAVDR